MKAKMFRLGKYILGLATFLLTLTMLWGVWERCKGGGVCLSAEGIMTIRVSQLVSVLLVILLEEIFVCLLEKPWPRLPKMAAALVCLLCSFAFSLMILGLLDYFCLLERIVLQLPLYQIGLLNILLAAAYGLYSRRLC